MSNSISNIEKQHAKQLSESFLCTYNALKKSSSAKRSDETYYGEIFDSCLLYFSYLDSCKQYIEYILRIERKLYRNEGNFQCSNEAREQLLLSEPIKWIHEAANKLNSFKEVDTLRLVRELQVKNKKLGQLNIKPFMDFISQEELLNSVVNLKNIENLTTSKVDKKFNKFVTRINTLFERVRLIPQISRFPKIILNQFNFPHKENDFFSIINDLVEIYIIENTLEYQNSNEANFYKVSEYIVNKSNKLNYKRFNNFTDVEKHKVIKVLTTFSVVEDESYVMNDNLTQLNNSAILSFSEHGSLNTYLQYLDKLWLQKIPRKNAKPVLKTSVVNIVNEQIKNFLNLSFDECLKRIYFYFIQKDSHDLQLAEIEKELINRVGVTSIEALNDELFSEVNKACSSFTNKNEMPLGLAMTFADSWSSFNEKESAENELFSRALLRLISSCGDTKSLVKANWHKVAVEQEICCLYRELFNHYLLGESLGNDFKKEIEIRYEEYLYEMFSVFKIWLIYLISQNIYIEKNKPKSLEHFILSNFILFINHRKKPASARAFIFGKEKNENSYYERLEINKNRHTQVPNIQTAEDINEATLSDYIDIETNQFDVTTKVKSILKINGVSLWDFISHTTTERLSRLWDSEIGFDTKELISFSLIQEFLNSAEKILKQEDKEIPQYLDSRGKLQKYIKNQWRNNFFTRIQNQTFPKIIFNFNKSFEDKLKDKLEVLSNLHSLNHDRYVIETQLGKGAFGVVYKAKDLILDTTIAIKLIPYWFRTEGVSRRLIKEASIMRNSQHENVVTVYDLERLPSHKLIPTSSCRINQLEAFDDDEDVFALIMEEVNNGLTLEAFLLSKDYNNDREALKHKLGLVRQICFALEKVHSQSVIHGDIKPENILVDENAIPKLTDFGIATEKGIDAIGASSMLFSSPASIKSGQCTIQDDIYSLGMMSIYVLSPIAKNLFKGVQKTNAYQVRRELYFCFLKCFIFLYYNLEREKNFKLEFLDKYKAQIINLSWYKNFDIDNLNTENATISKVISDIDSHFCQYELMLSFLHLVLRAISPSMDKKGEDDLWGCFFESAEFGSRSLTFEKINSADLYSFLLGQCFDTKPIRRNQNIQLYGQEIRSKDINYLLEDSDFFEIYRVRFHDVNSSNIKIEHLIDKEKNQNEKFLFWMSDNKGPVVSVLNVKRFSSRVIQSFDAHKDHSETHSDVISYLASIRNKQSHTHVTLNILEKLMIEHENGKRLGFFSRLKDLPVVFTSYESSQTSRFASNLFKKPIVLDALLKELNSIMADSLNDIEVISPITDRRIAKTYLSKVVFKNNYENLEPYLTEDAKEKQWQRFIKKEVSNWTDGTPEPEKIRLTQVNAFYDYLLLGESTEVLKKIKDCIEKYAMSESFGVLLKEHNLLEDTVKRDWEFQLYKAYKDKHDSLLSYKTS